MPTKPPDLKVPKAPPKKAKTSQAFNTFINKHKWMRPYAQLIATAARQNGIDALFLAALLNMESGGTANPKDHISGGGPVVGMAQIHLPSHPNVTAAQARDPKFAIKWAAQYVKKGYDKYGNYHDVYTKHYNPADPNREKGWQVINSSRPSGYNWGTSGQPSVPPKTTKERVQEQLRYESIREGLTQEGFRSEWDRINNVFYAYQGRNATRKEAEFLIGRGYSEYTLARALTKNKAFLKSPVWEAKSPEYMEVAKSIFGDQIPPGAKIKGLVREAIVNRWSETTFASKLRESPSYFKSNEWKKGVTTLENKYREIYGTPDEQAMVAIKEATMGRWNVDQWEHYLRSRPEYYNSREFKNRQYSLMSRLGFIPTGQQNPQYQGPMDTLPDSERIPNEPIQNYPPTSSKPPKSKKPKKTKPKPKKPKPTSVSIPTKPPLENY